LWARELSEFFVSNPAISRALIENVRICVSGRDEFVGAERGNFDEKTQTLLLENVDYKYSANEVVRSSRVVVHLQGPNAGRLSLAETPNRIIEISNEGFSPPAN
jgi:hypothetical protein